MTPNLLLWIRHDPFWFINWACGVGAFVILGLVIHWALFIPALLFVLPCVMYVRGVLRHFRIGDVVPGVVVATDPMLIAFSTDLTKGRGGSYPVVRVIRKNIPTCAGQAPRVGAKLAGVALYRVGPDPKCPHWDGFDPRPADCATSDQATLQRLMQSFSRDDWNALEEGVRRLPQPYRAGEFPMWA